MVGSLLRPHVDALVRAARAGLRNMFTDDVSGIKIKDKQLLQKYV